MPFPRILELWATGRGSRPTYAIETEGFLSRLTFGY